MIRKSIRQQVLLPVAHEHRRHFDNFLHRFSLYKTETFRISEVIEHITMT